jgi:hypothetical protein
VTNPARRAILDRVIAPFGLLLVLAAGAPAIEATCFDFSRPVREPLRPPILLTEGRDNSTYGTYPNGVDWASGRALLAMPIAEVYAKLLDHENVKDMSKTTLTTTVEERDGYLQFHKVDLVVTVRALFLKVKVAWTEAWGYVLTEGTAEHPLKIVVSYQKIAGSSHIQRECGSYVLEARGQAETDLAMYEETKADRRSARDTRDMHAGILAGLRAGR